MSHPFFLGTCLFIVTMALGIWWAITGYNIPVDAPKWLYVTFSVCWCVWFVAAIAQSLGILRLGKK